MTTPAWKQCLLAGALALVALHANLSLYHWFAMPPAPTHGVWQTLFPYYASFNRNDFGHLYLGAVAVSEGENPYSGRVLSRLMDERGVERLNPFVYPPFAALAGLPMAWLSYDGAFLAWTLLNAVFFAVAIGLLPLCLPAPRAIWWLAPLLIPALLSFPLYRSFSAGQLNVFLLLILVLAAVCLARGNQKAAGAVLAFGALVKVLPGLFLLYLILRRAWWGVASFFITLVALGLLTLLVVGWSHCWAFVEIARQMSYGSSTWQEVGMTFHVDPFNDGWPALVFRLLTHNPVTRGWTDAPGWASTISMAGALALLGAVAYAALDRRPGPFRFDAVRYWLFTGPMLLAPSLCWDHYYVLILPLCWLALLHTLQPPRPWLAGATLLCVLVLLAPYSYHPMDLVFRVLPLSRPPNLYEGPGILLLSPRTFAALGLLSITAMVLRLSEPVKTSKTA